MTVTAEKPNTLRVTIKNIPDELKKRQQWVMWKWTRKKGKWDKPPYQTNGRLADASNPQTWTGIREVEKAYRSGQFDGIGFMLHKDDPFAGIDLDDCRDPDTGEIEPWALDIIRHVDSYTEVSPSGTGVRIFIRGKLPAGGRKKGNIEMYDSTRYLTITGHVIHHESGIEDRQKQIEALHEQIFGTQTHTANDFNIELQADPDIDTEKLRQLLESSEKAKKTWYEEREDLNDQSPSGYDLALADICINRGWEPQEVVNLLIKRREMHGHDPKLDRPDYYERTIRKAIESLEKRKKEEATKDFTQPVIASPSNPLPNARAFLKQYFIDENGQKLLAYHDGWWKQWNGYSWQVIEATGLRKHLYRWLSDKRYIDAKGDIKPFNPNKHNVSNILDALQAEVYLPKDVQAPAWLKKSDIPAENILAMNNGLLDVTTGKLYPHDSTFFNSFHVPYDYDPDDIYGPTQWLTFLGSIWGDDQESIDTLQEIFGYLLTPDTSLQKMFLLIGPPRSGKGTIARVLTAMLGKENVVGPTLKGLTTNFGLQALIGKPAAIVSDARLSGQTDNQVVVERLLSITGEDSLTIDRKFQEPWTGKLPTRLIILSNELPKLVDSSGALAGRFIVLKMTKSFYGKEDPELTAKLLKEIPAILNWAMEGRKRLYERGYFIQPESALEDIRELQELSSPITAFINDMCEVGTGYQVEVKKIYEAWCNWCFTNGNSRPGDARTFGRNLKAAVPGINRKRVRQGNKREYVYDGIGLLQDSQEGWLE